jgi:hypothetical protein
MNPTKCLTFFLNFRPEQIVLHAETHRDLGENSLSELATGTVTELASELATGTVTGFIAELATEISSEPVT